MSFSCVFFRFKFHAQHVAFSSAQHFVPLLVGGAPSTPLSQGKGGKNRRRGKNEGEDKRELETKEEGQVRRCCSLLALALAGAASAGKHAHAFFLSDALFILSLPLMLRARRRSMPR